MKMYYASFLLTVAGNLLYHVSQKSIPPTANPFYVYILIYLIAILGCLVCSLLLPSGSTMLETIENSNWAVVTTGLAVLSIEIGFLLAYRAGWNVSLAAVACSVAVTILLLPIGVLAFKERITASNAIGITFCLLGLALVARK
jgi:uncharacterized membrane protein